MNDLPAFDFQLVIDARGEVVQDDHLRFRPKTVFLLDPDPDEGLDARASGDPAHGRDRALHGLVI